MSMRSGWGRLLGSIQKGGTTDVARLASWLEPRLADAKPSECAARVALTHTPHMGYGLAADGPVKQGEAILQVPKPLWYQTSARHAQHQAEARAPQFVQRVQAISQQLTDQGSRSGERLPEHILLALHLLFERGDVDSSTSAYARFLQPPEVPTFWGSDELSQLAGTRTATQAAKHSLFLKAVHSALGMPAVSLSQLTWAISVILSRALSGASTPYSLVPVLDFLNHSLVPTASHRFDHEREMFEVVALRDHLDGEEVFISYGNLPNDKLLHLYGFTLSNNPHNRAHVAISEPLICNSDPLARVKAAALAKIGADVNQHGIDLPHPSQRNNAMEEMLLPLARAATLTLEDLPQGSLVEVDVAQKVSKPNEQAALRFAKHAIQTQLRQYPTTMDADSDLIRQAGEENVTLPLRMVSALMVRVGEKEILEHALGSLAIMQSSLAST